MQKEKGVVEVDERLDSENARLNDLSAQLTILQAQKSEAQSRQHEARGNLDTNPDVINNPVIQNLRATITGAEAKLREASNQLGQNHPQIREQKAELDELRARLNTEMANVASEPRQPIRRSACRKEAETVAPHSMHTRKRVLDLKKQRDDVTVMQKDMEVTQQDYANISARLSQTRLESQTRQTNVAVLTPAFEPDEPSRPKVLTQHYRALFSSA